MSEAFKRERRSFVFQESAAGGVASVTPSPVKIQNLLNQVVVVSFRLNNELTEVSIPPNATIETVIAVLESSHYKDLCQAKIVKQIL